MFQGVNLPDGKYVIPTSVSRMVMMQPLTLCMLDHFAWFIVDFRFLLEFFLRKSFRNTIRVSNSLDSDHADSWSAGSRLLINVISRQQKLPLMRKTGNYKNDYHCSNNCRYGI